LSETDAIGFTAHGWVKITDPKTGEILVEQENAIHLGNLSAAIVMALCSDDKGHIRYMAFGNGGTRITSNGDILYRTPNVSNIRKVTDSLYNELFKKEIIFDGDNEVNPIFSNSTYSDLKALVTLSEIEAGLTQQVYDRADTLNRSTIDGSLTSYDEDAVFDELALYVGSPFISGLLSDNNEALMITHLIFNPIQKAANRGLQIEYTIRIQLT
jgi:hypothetical protein